MPPHLNSSVLLMGKIRIHMTNIGSRIEYAARTYRTRAYLRRIMRIDKHFFQKTLKSVTHTIGGETLQVVFHSPHTCRVSRYFGVPPQGSPNTALSAPTVHEANPSQSELNRSKDTGAAQSVVPLAMHSEVLVRP